MNSHKNAKLTARGREEMVRRMAHSPAAIVSAVFGVSVRTARKRKKRYQQGGVEVLADRSSRSVRCRSKLTESMHGKVFALRKQRQTGDDIAASLGLSRSTVFASCTNLIAPASPLWRKTSCATLSIGKARTNASSGYQASGQD